MRIPFNRPYVVGSELEYVAEAHGEGRLAGSGAFTRRVPDVVGAAPGSGKALLTHSCTAALEMAAMLCDLGPGDEVILPSFTFVSTANAFVRLGAKPVFVDIRPDTLNLDENLLEAAITPRTKAICPVHYAGVACAMERIMEIAARRHLLVVEDAAQGVHAFYAGRALGGIGHLGTYSFHDTKNYIAGEGGALCINAPEMVERAEIIRDKGTNRGQFLRGEVDKYTWVDVGSSYVPSEISCAFLYGQLEADFSHNEASTGLWQTLSRGFRLARTVLEGRAAASNRAAEGLPASMHTCITCCCMTSASGPRSSTT